MIRRCRFLLAGMLILFAYDMNAQSKSESYLFHLNPFRNEQSGGQQAERRVKVLLDFGLTSQFLTNDPHYTSGIKGDGAYTLGVRLSIPIQHNADIVTGIDFLHENFDFNSYFFYPGYSFLYNGDLNYNHLILMDEFQIPVLYKINFGSESRNAKNLYMTLGWIFRYIDYNNATVSEISNGGFVWEGQNDIKFALPFLTQYSSGAIEASLGYQHNTLRNGNGWFFEIEYRYGVSPFVYSGNENGSNNVQFTLNTLSFKLGIRI